MIAGLSSLSWISSLTWILSVLDNVESGGHMKAHSNSSHLCRHQIFNRASLIELLMYS
ncbi:hypothetical protein M758_4G054300 [Ceratodon purpureus]|uniref:Uncharacterized protein n=1 Tax=Ceratodon purpureus TaxID=3225 RepID=A0A8T0I935_CERPU|nr:hypothetical protein KC19_4G064300 [Ceratodon purpureus]KAG0618316.1 hypothetical protein M758_4G054300 [Ceratodon purpureus]